MLALKLSPDFKRGVHPQFDGKLDMMTAHILTVLWVILLIGLGTLVMVFANLRGNHMAPLAASLKSAPVPLKPCDSGIGEISQRASKSRPDLLRVCDHTESEHDWRMTPSPILSQEKVDCVDIPIS
jgi:hypothetical protein